MKRLLPLLFSVAVMASCRQKNSADFVLINAKIYTADSAFSVAEAMAVKDGTILATGTTEDILDTYETSSQVDAGGKPVFPGFIDGHSHFYRYGQGLQTVDLVGTTSWAEIVERVKVFATINKDGWLLGRGWDQNDWKDKNFPTNDTLNKLFPGRPILLSRIDGHAAIVNQAALDSAGVKPGQKINGGEIVMNGKVLSGLLVDNAVGLVSAKIPAPSIAQMNEALLDAQKNCFAAGLTSVVDCGLDYPMISVIDALQQSGNLKMRMNVMLSDDQKNFDYLFKNGPVSTPRLTVRSFKVYADGALGSRGACLLHPYADLPGHSGFLLSDKAHFEKVAALIAEKGFQMCTHAIGDSANREVLNIYKKVLKGKNDRRWRIEHAQVVAPADFALFGESNIIPSVQPTHATSDMYWAAERLGPQRVKSAYAYKQLLAQNGWMVLGTDFPVENINPMFTFYAAVARKDNKGFPTRGFQMENAISRKEALLGMTLWAARGSFEEKVKGSLEKGKVADFVILDQDIMRIPARKLWSVNVLKTYVNGEMVYAK